MTYPHQNKVFLIGKESTVGTAVSATKNVGLIQDIGNNFAQEVIQSKGIGTITAQQVSTGLYDLGHSIAVHFQTGRLLEYVFGSVAHDTTSDDTKHTFSISKTPPSFTAESSESGDTDGYVKSVGNIIESAEISTELNGFLTLNVASKCLNAYGTGSASSYSALDLQKFPHQQVSISIDDTQATEVQNFSISISKTVERSGGVGSTIYQQIHPVDFEISFSGTLGFTGNTFQNLFFGGSTATETASPTAFNVVLDANNAVTLGSGRRELYLALNNCQFSTFNKVASVGSLIFVDVEGVGLFNTCYSTDNISSAQW